MLDAYPILTLLPPLLAIILVIATRKVLISLGAGIVAAGLVLADFNPLTMVVWVWDAIVRLVWVDDAINWFTILIVAFLFQLGMITSLVMMSGGAAAFTEWAAGRIKSRRGAQVLTGLLGMIIFIDDYFNALAVGQVARPITDRYRVSRAKLAYLIDSSSAPVVVLMPLSSWGATIMGIMAPVLTASALMITQLEAFVLSAVMNYYAIAALLLLWLTILLGLDFGSMRREEQRAVAGNGLHRPDEEPPAQLTDTVPTHNHGAMRALILPFVVLFIGVIIGMYVSGGILGGSWALLETLENTDVAIALNVGGIAAFIVALYYCLRYTKHSETFPTGTRRRGVLHGAKSMLGAIFILLFAWVLGDLIDQLGTGEYLASVVDALAMPAVWLVPALFVIAALIAFATGTSWGSFGILLPLAGDMMNAVPGGDALLIASFGAVLAGAVWGDHSSPISDTTILSSTGAACSIPTHVATQLPYAFVGALAALAGYVTYALTQSGIIGLVVTLGVVVIIAAVIRKTRPPVQESAQVAVSAP
ncbi:MAG TPA: Na+/H+ antiporter NhaC family protein [Enteractinococcus sp.]